MNCPWTKFLDVLICSWSNIYCLEMNRVGGNFWVESSIWPSHQTIGFLKKSDFRDFWEKNQILRKKLGGQTGFQMVRLRLFFALFISNLSAYVWKASGNGIIPHLNVPVRTVFIQVYEDDGETPVDVRDLEERKLERFRTNRPLICFQRTLSKLYSNLKMEIYVQ